MVLYKYLNLSNYQHNQLVVEVVEAEEVVVVEVVEAEVVVLVVDHISFDKVLRLVLLKVLDLV